MSPMVSDKRTQPIFVQAQGLKHKFGKNTVGFSYKPQEPLGVGVRTNIHPLSHHPKMSPNPSTFLNLHLFQTRLDKLNDVEVGLQTFMKIRINLMNIRARPRLMSADGRRTEGTAQQIQIQIRIQIKIQIYIQIK